MACLFTRIETVLPKSAEDAKNTGRYNRFFFAGNALPDQYRFLDIWIYANSFSNLIA